MTIRGGDKGEVASYQKDENTRITEQTRSMSAWVTKRNKKKER